MLPDLVADITRLIAALAEFVIEHSPRVILPTGDVTIGVLLTGSAGRLGDLRSTTDNPSEAACDTGNLGIQLVTAAALGA